MSRVSSSGAVEAVVNNKMSVRRTWEFRSQPYGIMCRAEFFLGHIGPPRYLNTEGEEELEQFLFGSESDAGEVMALVRNKIGRLSNGWWESFCKSHPTITLRTGATLSNAHAVASDPACII